MRHGGCYRFLLRRPSGPELAELGLLSKGGRRKPVVDRVFGANRRTVLGAGMMGVRGRIQREGEVVHLVAHSLTDLTKEFASVSRRGRAEDGPADVATTAAQPRMPAPKTMADPYGHIDVIRVKTRDFR